MFTGNKRKKHTGGFTLVELIVMIAVMAILSAFIVSNIKKQQIKARDRARVSDIKLIRLALEDYHLACGEYPERLAPDTNNGCRYGQKLSDFLPYIPVNPPYDSGITIQLVGPGGDYENSQVSDDNTYLYAGLSDSPHGKCYDYHLGAVLGSSEFNTGTHNTFLDQDHDAYAGEGRFKYRCRNSKPDFGDNNNGEDDAYGLYDFRSHFNVSTK